VGVFSDPAALATLPPRELRSGLGEVLKYGLLRPGILDRLAAEARTGRVSGRTIAGCAAVKLEVVERDPRERAERKLLNLGHTFGHGVEAAGGFRRWKHGEAVAVGLAFSFRLARVLGRVGDAEVERVEAVLREAGLPVNVDPSAARKARLLMTHDKKRSAAGLLWVLPIRRPRDWAVEWDVVADPVAVREAAREMGRPG
jgi:3-dehydroquinate synthetase